MCRKCQKSSAVVLAFSRGKEANSKLGIDPVLPEIVFSSRAKRLEGEVLFFAISTERTSSLVHSGCLLVPRQNPNFISYHVELQVHSVFLFSCSEWAK